MNDQYFKQEEEYNEKKIDENSKTKEAEEFPKIPIDDSMHTRPKRNTIVANLIGLEQGIIVWASFSTRYITKDLFKYDPYQMTILISVLQFPWICKPIWGFISDSLPICGYRRKVYVLITNTLMLVTFLILYLYFDVSRIFPVMLFLGSFSLAFSMVIGEALIVESSQSGSSKVIVSNYSLFKSISYLTTSISAGFLVKAFKKNEILFLLSSIFPVIVLFAGLFMKEYKISEIRDLHKSNMTKSQIRLALDFVRQPHVYKLLIFLILLVGVPSYNDAMFYFYTNTLKFTETDISILQFVSFLAYAFAILLYKKLLYRFRVLNIIFCACIFAMMCDFLSIVVTQRWNIKLGFSDFYFCLMSDALKSAIWETALLPVLVLFSSICPPMIEGTVYALLMSTLSLGQFISSISGFVVSKEVGITNTNYDLIWVLILVSLICTVIPMLGLKCFVRLGNVEKEARERDKGFDNI